jgi:hypothetical protein
LQQLNSTIVENIRLQNERIARIEERLPAVASEVTKDVGQLGGSDAGHEESDNRDNGDQDSGTSLIAGEVGGHKRRDDQEDEDQDEEDREETGTSLVTDEIRVHEPPDPPSSRLRPGPVKNQVAGEASDNQGRLDGEQAVPGESILRNIISNDEWFLDCPRVHFSKLRQY